MKRPSRLQHPNNLKPNNISDSDQEDGNKIKQMRENFQLETDLQIQEKKPQKEISSPLNFRKRKSSNQSPTNRQKLKLNFNQEESSSPDSKKSPVNRLKLDLSQNSMSKKSMQNDYDQAPMIDEMVEEDSYEEKKKGLTNMSINHFFAKKKFQKQPLAIDLQKVKQKEKQFKDKLLKINQARLASKYKTDNIINQSVMGNNQGNSHRNKELEQKRYIKLSKLGDLGLQMEELALDIEKRYEHMIITLRDEIKQIRDSFCDSLQEIEKRVYEELMNEKDQNLKNLETLEQELAKSQEETKKQREKARKAQNPTPNMTRNGVNIDNSQNKGQAPQNSNQSASQLIGQLAQSSSFNPNNSKSINQSVNYQLQEEYLQEELVKSFKEFFKFVTNFKEECFQLILTSLNLVKMKDINKDIGEFMKKHLSNLHKSAGCFPTELRGHFEKKVKEEKEEIDVKGEGNYITLYSMFTERISVKKQEMSLESICSNKRTPIIYVLNSKLAIVASRSHFNIYEYDYSKRKGVGLKKQSRFANMGAEEKIMDAPNLQFKEVFNSSSDDMEPELRSVDIHCIELVDFKDGKMDLVMGCRNNIIIQFSISFDQDDSLDEIKFKRKLDLSPEMKVPRQKVQCILKYQNTGLIIAGFSFGFVAVIDLNTKEKKPEIRINRIHRGNITSMTFVNNYEYLVTCSGSFSRNHDNTIRVFHVINVLQYLFMKEIHSFPHAHGKFKGVMSVKSSNNVEDYMVVSCGNEDDGKIIIWNVLNRERIHEFEPEGKNAFYFLNCLMIFKDDEEEDESFSEPSNDEDESPYQGIIILAAGIKKLQIYAFDFDQQKVVLDESLPLSDDVGSYFQCMQMVKHKEEELSLMISNVRGELEIFTVKIEPELQLNILAGIGGGCLLDNMDGGFSQSHQKPSLFGSSSGLLKNAGQEDKEKNNMSVKFKMDKYHISEEDESSQQESFNNKEIDMEENLSDGFEQQVKKVKIMNSKQQSSNNFDQDYSQPQKQMSRTELRNQIRKSNVSSPIGMANVQENQQDYEQDKRTNFELKKIPTIQRQLDEDSQKDFSSVGEEQIKMNINMNEFEADFGMNAQLGIIQPPGMDSEDNIDLGPLNM